MTPKLNPKAHNPEDCDLGCLLLWILSRWKLVSKNNVEVMSQEEEEEEIGTLTPRPQNGYIEMHWNVLGIWYCDKTQHGKTFNHQP